MLPKSPVGDDDLDLSSGEEDDSTLFFVNAESLSDYFLETRIVDLTSCYVGSRLLNDKDLEVLRIDVKVLNVSCTDVSDVGAMYIAKTFSQLQELSLGACHLTDKGLCALASLKNIKKISIDGCFCVSSDGLCKLLDAWASCKKSKNNLEELSCRFCEKGVTDKVLTRLQKFPYLKKLTLEECKNVTDKGIASLALAKKLRQLDVCKCFKVTTKALHALEQVKTVRFICPTEVIKLWKLKWKHTGDNWWKRRKSGGYL